MTQDTFTPVVAVLVDEKQRLNFLPSYFGVRSMMRGEALVFAWMKSLSVDYSRGLWNFYELTNGGFYMAPSTPGLLRINVTGNGFSSKVSADAAGIIATMFALSQLMHEVHGTDACDPLIEKYYYLRDFAIAHVEADLILAATD